MILQKHRATDSMFNADAAVPFQYFSSEDFGKFVLTCLQLNACTCVYVTFHGHQAHLVNCMFSCMLESQYSFEEQSKDR